MVLADAKRRTARTIVTANTIIAAKDAEIARLKGLLREAGRELSIFTTPEELVCRIRSAVEEDPASDQG